MYNIHEGTEESIVACVARCGFKAPLSEFPLSATLKYLKTCVLCLEKQTLYRANQQEKENIEVQNPPTDKQKTPEKHPTLS
jgi:hypothetical protein